MWEEFTSLVRRLLCILAVAAAVLPLAPSPSWAVVLQPGGGLPPITPGDDLVGRWNDNASCVVIGTDFVLTTLHQGGGVGSVVQVGGTNYNVSQVWTMGPSGPDMQIAQLAGASFTQFAAISTFRNELAPPMTVAIGGYGQGAGAALYYQGDSNIPYGYAWDGSSNATLRWGQNKLVATMSYTDPALGYTSSLLMDQFDGPNSAGAVPGEAALGDYDSGSGWFRQVNGNWSLVALGWGTDHAALAQSWFGDPNAPGNNPEYNYAIRISQYAGWIDGVTGSVVVTPEPASLVILVAGAAFFLRRRRGAE